VTYRDVNGRPISMSFSACDTFERCQRKWWYGYVLRIRDSGSQAARLGTEMHALLEDYITDGSLGDEAARPWTLLQPALALLPEGELQAEFSITDLSCGPLPFKGFVDWTVGGEYIVGDLKTSSNPERYGKTPEELAKFRQPLSYAYGMWRDDPPSAVDFQHIYVKTRGAPMEFEIWARDVPWLAVEENWSEMEAVAVQMAALIDLGFEAEEEIPVNQFACRDFGGCPHAARCSKSPQNVTSNYTPENRNEDAPNLAAILAQLGMSPPPKEERIMEEVPQAPTTQAEASTVYVDCMPAGRAVATMDEVLASSYARIEAAYDVPHWSCVDYAKGGNDALGDFALSTSAPTEIYVDGRHPLASRFVEIMVRRGAFVVRGTR